MNQKQLMVCTIWSGVDSVVQCRFHINIMSDSSKPESLQLQVFCTTGYKAGDTVVEFGEDISQAELAKLLASGLLLERVRELYAEAELEAAKEYGDIFH